ncbi:MAG TPA: ATP-binding protein [Abditibacteriaceae bacterium]|jgi:serine/threonine-protein kinase RsbW
MDNTQPAITPPPPAIEPLPEVVAEPSEAVPNSVHIQIPSSTEFVRVVRLAVLGVASRMMFTYDDVEDIKLAVSEACNNAILHARTASDSRPQAMIDIKITPMSDRLEICVADQGRVPPPGIRPGRATSPHAGLDSSGAIGHTSLQDLRENGLGLFLMQSLMDEVEHRTGEDANTEVRMVKLLPNTDGPTTE